MNNKTTSNLLGLILKASIVGICGAMFPVIYLFFPAMFVTESIKEGILKTMAVFLFVCVLVGAVFGVNMAVAILTVFGPMILIFNFMIINKFSVNTTIISTAILFFVSMIFMAYTAGVTPDMLKSQDTINSFIEMQNGLLSQGRDLGEISLVDATALYNRSLQLMPAVLLLISLCISYITYTRTGRNLLKSDKLIIQPSSFVFFRLPNEMIISGVIGILGVFLFQDFVGSTYKIIIENIVIVFAALLFFQGLSVIKYLMMRSKVNLFLQNLLILGAFVIPGVQFFFVIVGIVDMIFNFRKIPS